MGACTHEYEEAALNLVDQQPVGSKMAFTMIHVVACQEVVPMMWLQWLLLSKPFNDLTELDHGFPLALNLFNVLLEAVGGAQV